MLGVGVYYYYYYYGLDGISCFRRRVAYLLQGLASPMAAQRPEADTAALAFGQCQAPRSRSVVDRDGLRK